MSFFIFFIFAFIAIILLLLLWLYKQKAPTGSSELPYKTSKIHSFKGLNIHYQQSGRGKDLVLLHGIGASTYIWRYISPILENSYRVTAIDIPGFGLSSKSLAHDHSLDSQATFIHEFLQEIQIKEAYLAGSSMGGAIALWMNVLYPKSYKKIVAMSPAVNPRHTKRVRLKYINLMGRRFRFFLNTRVMAQILRFVVGKKELYAIEHLEAYLRPYQDDGTSILCFMDAFDHLLTDRRLPRELKRVQADVLLIWGKKDLLTPFKYADELLQIIPKSTIVVHDTAGHHMMEEEPDWTAKNLAGFLGT